MNFFVNKMQAVVKKPHFLKKAGKHIYKNKNMHKFLHKNDIWVNKRCQEGILWKFHTAKDKAKKQEKFCLLSKK